MGNGQSSPTSAHSGSGPAPQKPSAPTHRDNHQRSASPATRRRKSLELPDLASLTFTSATSTTTSTPTSTNGPPAAPPPNVNSSGGKFSSLGRPGGLGRKRPSPLAPAMSTTPLSPITTKTTTAQNKTDEAQHNPYFPPAQHTQPTPMAIPTSHQQAPLLSSGLPDYSRMTYDGDRQQSYMPTSPPADAPAKPSPQPGTPKPSVTKKARLVDPKGHPQSTTPLSTPPSQQPRQHKPHQPSVGGADEDNYIRSSLPLGGDDASSGRSTPRLGPTSSLATPARDRPDEDMADSASQDTGVPTIINWTGGGKEVFVCGTFAKNWGERVKMSKRSAPVPFLPPRLLARVSLLSRPRRCKAYDD